MILAAHAAGTLGIPHSYSEASSVARQSPVNTTLELHTTQNIWYFVNITVGGAVYPVAIDTGR